MRVSSMRRIGWMCILRVIAITGGLSCLAGCATQAGDSDSASRSNGNGGSSAGGTVNTGEGSSAGGTVNASTASVVRGFEACASRYLVTTEALALQLPPANLQPVCQVPQDGAVASRALNAAEARPEGRDWLAVSYELCRGWVESSKVRCLTAGEQPAWSFLPVPYHNQLSETDSTLWDPFTTCGSTALAMVFDYYGWEDDVNVVTARLAAIDPLAGGYDPSCSKNPVCVSSAAVATVAAHYCSAVTAGDNWTQQDVIKTLIDGKPIVALVTSDLVPGSSGHAITIIGFLERGDRIIYLDPARAGDDSSGEHYFVVSWDKLAASWVGPNDMGDPMQPDGHSFWGLSCAD